MAGPVVCEVMVAPNEERIPRAASYIKPDGSMGSKPLEDLYPIPRPRGIQAEHAGAADQRNKAAHELPIRNPTKKTSAPPKPTCRTAEVNGRVHIAVANPGNHAQLHADHNQGNCRRGMNIGNEKGQGVAQGRPPLSCFRKPRPRAQGCPRPVRVPSSDNASANPMLIPRPGWRPIPPERPTCSVQWRKRRQRAGRGLKPNHPSTRPVRAGPLARQTGVFPSRFPPRSN